MSRKKQSTFEDFIEVASLLPWWAGLSLAIISFVILHYFANISLEPIRDMNQMGNFVPKQLFITFAKFGQLILPFCFSLGALISAINKNRREKLFSSVEKYQHNKSNITINLTDPIKNMSWKDFELLISEFFRRQGYSVKENNFGGPDGGIDLRIGKNGKEILVQCKHWKTLKIGVNIVREQLGVKIAERADGVIIVTSGAFTDEAINFAKQQDITLISGHELNEIILKNRESVSGELAYSSKLPVCPLCSSPMVERTAKKGAAAGRKFWGCTRYPNCKGTVSK